MKETHERPVCHRAEDLVSYLYGEAGATDAVDFRSHLQQCAACRREFTVFNQVHDSIQLWRQEALGASFNPAEVSVESAADSPQVSNQPRQPSALAALREFFNLSPLWLRGATAFAGLLLCVLGMALIFSLSRKPADQTAKNDEKLYTQQELQNEIDKAVNRTVAELTNKQNDQTEGIKEEPRRIVNRPQMATNRPKLTQPRSLNRQEREQLAADLRVTLPADDDESLLALPEQEIPHQ